MEKGLLMKAIARTIEHYKRTPLNKLFMYMVSEDEATAALINPNETLDEKKIPPLRTWLQSLCALAAKTKSDYERAIAVQQSGGTWGRQGQDHGNDNRNGGQGNNAQGQKNKRKRETEQETPKATNVTAEGDSKALCNTRHMGVIVL